ncbi:S8/S53 family peptidase [Nocardioides nanhaiensis]|uniref:Peptidase S8/S53 domain-containing protein n=1 Tax=Nocardioides nanhaiensis TaxID=1476871 RepID=A0ABP8WAQ5_9ACTN
MRRDQQLSRPGGRRRGLAAVAAGGLACTLLALPVATAPSAWAADSCESIALDTEPGEPPEENEVGDRLRLDDVHAWLEARGLGLGDGTQVAVVAGGVKPVPGLPVVPTASSLVGREIEMYEGTALAGLVAGGEEEGLQVGVAPGAEVLDARIMDSFAGGEGGLYDFNATATVAMLGALATTDVDVVAMPFPLPDSPELQRAVRTLLDRDVIVVAAAGDRPQAEEEPLAEDYLESEGEGETEAPSGFSPREDAVADAFPAGYDHPLLLSVSSTAFSGDPQQFVLPNSGIDLVAPTEGAVTFALNDTLCVLDTPGSAWATGTIAGVLALVRSAHPDDTPRQVVARVLETATGGEDPAPGNRLSGRGVVQPFQAVTAALRPARDGEVASSQSRDRTEAAPVPQDDPDLLAGTRRNAVWWGLLGGGALLVAVVVRPLVTRRRG